MKPKRLNIKEMWRLYLLLKPALDAHPSQDYLIDEVISLLEHSPQGTLVGCLTILYNDIDISKINPAQAALLFIKGLKQNEFFEFVDTIRNIYGTPTGRTGTI